MAQDTSLYHIGPVLHRVAFYLGGDAHAALRNVYDTGDARVQLCLQSHLDTVALNLNRYPYDFERLVPPRYTSRKRLRHLDLTMNRRATNPSLLVLCGPLIRSLSAVDDVTRVWPDMSTMASLSMLRMTVSPCQFRDTRWPSSLTSLEIGWHRMCSEDMALLPGTLTALKLENAAPVPANYVTTHPNLTHLQFRHLYQDIADVLPATLRSLVFSDRVEERYFASPWPCRELQSFSIDALYPSMPSFVWPWLPPSLTYIGAVVRFGAVTLGDWCRQLVQVSITVDQTDQSLKDRLLCMPNLRRLKVYTGSRGGARPAGGSARVQVLPCTPTVETLKLFGENLRFRTSPEDTASLAHLVIMSPGESYEHGPVRPSSVCIDGFGVRPRSRPVCLTTQYIHPCETFFYPSTIRRFINGSRFVSALYYHREDDGEIPCEADDPGTNVHDSVAFLVRDDGSVSFTELAPRGTAFRQQDEHFFPQERQW